MTWQFPVASLPPLLAAILELTLAALLLRAGRGRRASLALALLLVSGASADLLVFVFGGFTTTYPTAVAITFTYAFWVFGGFLWMCFGAMLLDERARLPRILAAFPTYLAPAFALATLGLWHPELVYDFTSFLSAPLAADAPSDSFPFSHPQVLSFVLGIIGLSRPIMAGVLAWWALRREATSEWSSVLLVAVAAGGTYLINAAAIVAPARDPLTFFQAGARVELLVGACVSVVVFAGLVHEAIRGRPERRRLARLGAGFMLFMALAGAWIERQSFGDPLVFPTFLALSALPFPVISTYALLRHRLLGLDVKLRFAISRSTVAAAFVAAFFLASEGAQILFGQGNEWIGLLAAGALVFALAPLQRAAERLAERAVPVAEPVLSPRATDPSRAEDAYRAVLRRYLQDGGLTRDEERALAMLAGELRLDAGRAFELREQVERDVGAEVP